MHERSCLLVVEDAEIAEQLREFWTLKGWHLHSCTSARDALHVVRHRKVDALVIAAALPDERGDVVFYRFTAMQPHLRARTVFLAKTEPEERVVRTTRCLALRMPVSAQQLVETVEGLG